MGTTRARSRIAAAAVAVVLGAAGVAAGAGSAGAGQGSGNPRLAVSNATLFSDRANTITVTGTDYLVPPHAPGANVFGGVYLFFGWVKPGTAWGPSWKTSTSNDGNFGYTYHYAGDGGDPSTRDDGSGTMRLVSFTAGGDSGHATDYHMDDAGNWTTTLVVRGSKYQYQDPQTGRAVTVDCQAVQCGVYTIGAHGKASRTNEKFVPLTFVGTPPATIVPGQPVPSGTPDPGLAPAPPAAGTSANPAASSSTTTPTTVAPAAPEATEELPETGSDEKRATRSKSTKVALSPTSSSEDAGGSSAWVWIGGAVVLVGAGGGTYWYLRRRSRVTA